MADQNKTISWEAYEFKHYPKNTGWYITLVSIAVLVMLYFIVVETDIFAAVCLGLITLIIVVFSRQKPQRVEIELNSKGVRFGNLVYPYKQIKHFWIVHNERHQTVNLRTSALVNNTVILELENQHPESAREYLLKHIPEHHETEETAIQKIMHRFKF